MAAGEKVLELRFQSTLPRRERRKITRSRRQRYSGFQSTLPRRERRLFWLFFPHFQVFQSTLPRRERRGRTENKRSVTDFNPRSREGSDGSSRRRPVPEEKFQSTLPRRERPDVPCGVSPFFQFQSTLPRRERLFAVSLIMTRCYFNPRSREGSDEKCQRSVLPIFYFNPRSREGSDLVIINSNFFNDNFNPRSREGSDVNAVLLANYVCISIHAPAKGATAILYNKFHFLCIILYILSAIT